MVRFLMAASHAGTLGYRVDESALRDLLKNDEAAMRADMKAGGLANAAYTYREISDEDLGAYAEALEHPKMQQVYELMNAVQFEVMANRFEVLASKLAELHPGEEL
jgi:vesicle coat complex subunit